MATTTRPRGDAGETSAPRRSAVEHAYLLPLDTMRGVGIILVLATHLPPEAKLRYPYAPGAWLGVSMFFTISGFLICRQLIGAARRDELNLVSFWTRRFNRLFPAAFLCIAAVMVLSVTGPLTVLPTFRHQLVATIFYASNWYRLREAGADVFGQFWSLAVEEQFYLVFPLLFVLLFRRVRRQAPWILAGLTVASSALTVWAAGHRPLDEVYTGTHTRFGEILAGVTFAYVVMSPRFAEVVRRGWFRAISQLLGLFGLAVYAWLWSTKDQLERANYGWPLMLNTVATLCVITCSLVPGPVTRAVSPRPFRWLGRLSYGVYVYHLAIFTALGAWLDMDHPTALAAIMVGATVLAAWLSFRFVEYPIWKHSRLSPRQVFVRWACVSIVLAVAAQTLPFRHTAEDTHTKLGSGGFAALDAEASADATRVAVLGDQSARSSAEGLRALMEDHRGRYWATAHIQEDCPLSGVADRALGGRATAVSVACRTWRFVSPTVARDDDADRIVLLGGIAVLADQDWTGPQGRTWAHPGTAGYAADLETRLSELGRSLTARGARLDWYLLDPDVAVGEFRAMERRASAAPGPSAKPSDASPLPPAPPSPDDAELRARVEAFNRLVRSAAEDVDRVHVHPAPPGGRLTAGAWDDLLHAR